MTALDMESVIMEVLNEHWRAHVDIAGDDIRYVCECGTVEIVKGSGHSSTTTWSRAHQARAVLAAISEAGAIEWGVKYGSVHPYESEAAAREQLRYAQMDVPATLVNRVAAGKWVEVEG